MSEELTPLIVAFCLFAALFIGRVVNRFLPHDYLSPETRDTMKLAVGWVGTMAALILGLLVNSAKTNYDNQRNTVIQLSAKIALLDRALGLYGPEAGDARIQLRSATDHVVQKLWPDDSNIQPVLMPESQVGPSIYIAISGLAPVDDTQRTIKTQALVIAGQIGELRALLVAQSVAYISQPLLIVLLTWLVVILLCFSLLAPPNATAMTTLIISAFSIAGAIFLIVELDQTFSGLIRVPNESMVRVLSTMGK